MSTNLNSAETSHAPFQSRRCEHDAVVRQRLAIWPVCNGLRCGYSLGIQRRTKRCNMGVCSAAGQHFAKCAAAHQPPVQPHGIVQSDDRSPDVAPLCDCCGRHWIELCALFAWMSSVLNFVRLSCPSRYYHNPPASSSFSNRNRPPCGPTCDTFGTRPTSQHSWTCKVLPVALVVFVVLGGACRCAAGCSTRSIALVHFVAADFAPGVAPILGAPTLTCACAAFASALHDEGDLAKCSPSLHARRLQE